MNVAQNRGLERLHNITEPLKFTPDRTLAVAMVTKWLFLSSKLTVAQLCKKMAQNLVPNTNTFFIIVTTCHNHLAQ